MKILAAEIKKGFFYIITYFLGKVKCALAYTRFEETLSLAGPHMIHLI